MSAPGTRKRLRHPESLDLRVVVVGGVVVPEPDCCPVEGTARDELERIADQQLRPRESEALQVRLDLLQARVAKAQAVDADEALAVVAEHRGDQARAVVDADLDVRLVRAEQGRREVEQREDVLGREVLDLVDDRLEPAVARVLRVREVVEQPGQLAEEAVGVQRVTGGSSRLRGPAPPTEARTTRARSARRRGRGRRSRA